MFAWWIEVWATLQNELSVWPDPVEFARSGLSVVTAIFLAGLLGYEREKKGSGAGLRTHMLVGLGSALFVVVPLQVGMSIPDISRVLQGVIAGIGFLGAGAIIKLSNDEKIRGLTTAASIWLTAAIGIAAGMGERAIAICTTLLALFILTLLGKKNRSRSSGFAQSIARSRQGNRQSSE